MAVNWSKVDWSPNWKGLFARRQAAPNDRFYADIALNVDLRGGTLAKRDGCQYQTGWGAFAPAAWSNGTTGDVNDASGFAALQVISVSDPIHGSATRTLVNVSGNTITFTLALGFTPTIRTTFTNFRPLGTGLQRVDGLFNAVFRDGSMALLGWCNGVLASVKPPPTATVLPTLNFPETTVQTGDSWVSTSTGKLGTLETVRIGDLLYRVATDEQVTVVSINGKTTQASLTNVDIRSRIVGVSSAFATLPLTGAVFRFFPKPAAGDAHFVQFANLTHMASAHYPPIKLTAAAGVVQRHGIAPPTTSPDAGVGGAGAMEAGTRTYRVKFLNSTTGQESEPSPISNSVTVGANASVVLTSIPKSPDPQVDRKRIYRTYAGGAGVWFFLTEMPNSQTTYNGTAGENPMGPDAASDVALGTQMREFLDNAIPFGATVLGMWPQTTRLFAVTSGGSALVFSDEPDLETGFLKGEAWPVNNQIFLNFDDGDAIVGGIGFFDSLLIFKGRSIFRITGLPPNITIEPVSFRSDLTAIGALNQKAIAVDQNEVLFAAVDGVYQIDRFWGVQQGFQSQRITRQIDELYQTLNTDPAVMSKTHAVFFRRFHQYRLFIPLGNIIEARDVLVHQFDGTPEGEALGWTQWRYNSFFPTASCAAEGTPDAIYIGTDQGDVLKLDQGALDGGTEAYSWQHRLVPFTPAGPGIPARGRAFDLVLLPTTDCTLNLGVVQDFGTAGPTVALPFVAAVVPVTHRSLVLVRGQWHQLDLQESGFNTAFRVMAFDYFVQALPPTSRTVDALQGAPTYPTT